MPLSLKCPNILGGIHLIRKILQYYYKRRGKVSPVRTIVLSFGFIIFLGTALLMLPIASRNRESAGFLTALFSSTSATCVTGLVVVETGLQWSAFGQAVILCLIQIGGLGFMTVISAFFFLSGRKIGLKERMVIAQSYSLNSLQGVVALVRKAALWTFSAEGIGAVILTIRFAADMSFGRAVWCGVFHSVSAFCNAGFDILASVETGGSLTAYAGDAIVNVTLMLLILCGGLGFFVLGDIFTNRKWRKFSVYTKLVLVINALLLLGGAAVFAALEWSNPESFGTLNAGEKILAAFFQSVTTRTAGFYTVHQGSLSEAALAVSDLLMFIGGSSGSTAGGVKTVTFGVTVLSAIAALRGKSKVTVFKRTISQQQLRDATCLISVMFALVFAGTVFVSVANGVGLSDALFEVISALCTVGLSTGITAGLGAATKLLLILYMFFGRVGIMTFSLAFLFGDRTEERYSFAEEKIMIG